MSGGSGGDCQRTENVAFEVVVDVPTQLPVVEFQSLKTLVLPEV
jgi:hypothetical protein